MINLEIVGLFYLIFSFTLGGVATGLSIKWWTNSHDSRRIAANIVSELLENLERIRVRNSSNASDQRLILDELNACIDNSDSILPSTDLPRIRRAFEQSLLFADELSDALSRAHQQMSLQANHSRSENPAKAYQQVLDASQFQEVLKRSVAVFERYQAPFAVVTIQIVNIDLSEPLLDDHMTNEQLSSLLGLCGDTLRETDCLGRINENQLAILLPESQLEEASVTAQRLKQLIETQTEFQIHVAAAEALDGDTDRTLLERLNLALTMVGQVGDGNIFIHDGIRSAAHDEELLQTDA